MIRKRFLVPFISLIVALILGYVLSVKLLPDYYWFNSFNKSSIWLKTLVFQGKTFLGFFFIAYVLIRSQVAIALTLAKYAQKDPYPLLLSKPLEMVSDLFKAYEKFLSDSNVIIWSKRIIGIGLEILIFVVSFGLAWGAKALWLQLQLAQHAVSFNLLDPLFNKDIAFYIFHFPVLHQLLSWINVCVFIAFLASLWIYFSRNTLLKLFSSSRNITPKFHLSCLLALLILGLAGSFYLNQFDILLSSRGSVFGAGFTDFHASLLYYRVQAVILIALAVSLILWGFNHKIKIIYLNLALTILNPIILGGLVPNIIQSYKVEPNEIKAEEPFIKHNINYTRQAYGLQDVKEISFDVSKKLNQETLNNNKSLLRNIRLWNEEPLKQTFKQLQEIRLYYEFNNIDVDRYMIDGNMQQVMLSARELDINQLSDKAKTWVNQHLIYTHGFGLCMSPVNIKTSEGLPQFLIKDLPPQGHPELSITQPEIYFGEQSKNTVIVNTKQKEFNYPKEEKNQETQYKGAGGIVLDSLFKRAILSLHLSDIKLLISNYITPESRVLFNRDIKSIVQKTTPFFYFDSDPYLTITPEGKLLWFLDAYTTSTYFPYSEPFKNRLNYIRNSVLITIDAYDGKLTYYLKDPTDPIAQAIKKIFPNLFDAKDKIPENILNHVRYPRDLFAIQTEMYKTYHMTNPQIFYNREDLWNIPTETYGESEAIMKPYYVVSRYPKEANDSFSLVLPFTPAKKNNMVAFFRATSDAENYGKLTVYKFPKERTIFGPMQIESRIDQDTEISQKLTLWGQKGSRVIRGNLMVMPVNDTLLYAEPIYLQATQSKLPELKRIILAHNNVVVMTEDLSEGLQRITTGNPIAQENTPSTFSSTQTGTSKQQLLQVINALKATIQSSLKQLDATLEKLKKIDNNK